MSLTILIIDDEPYLPHQFARYLRKHGYEVHTAADGETGLAEMQRNTIDLVLLDLRLPKISGLDLLTQIRKIDQDVPVVMLTAYGDVQTAVAAMKLGACDYLLKGFDLDELLMGSRSTCHPRAECPCQRAIPCPQLCGYCQQLARK